MTLHIDELYEQTGRADRRQIGESIAVRAEVKPSEKSTPDRPLWVWRLWKDGREVAVGFEPSREQAEQQVERAKTAAERRLGSGCDPWGGGR